MDMKSLLEFLPIGPTYNLSNMLKQLLFGSPGGSYGMIKSRFVASFQQILDPGFGGDSAPAPINLNTPENWEGLDDTVSLKCLFS